MEKSAIPCGYMEMRFSFVDKVTKISNLEMMKDLKEINTFLENHLHLIDFF
ncbi:hypothetical protein ACFLT1_01120 [Bacteroidota bacterium]